MVLGIGNDVVSLKRIQKILLKNKDCFIKKCLNKNEIEEINPLKTRDVEKIAAKWAAKEAFSKAIGIGLQKGISLTDIEIKKNDLGSPKIILHGKTEEIFNLMKKDKECIIHLSISHDAGICFAVVVID